MSITISTDVFCDKCGKWVEGVSGRPYADIRNARKNAKLFGWIRKKEGKKFLDICRECRNDNPNQIT